MSSSFLDIPQSTVSVITVLLQLRHEVVDHTKLQREVWRHQRSADSISSKRLLALITAQKLLWELRHCMGFYG